MLEERDQVGETLIGPHREFGRDCIPDRLYRPGVPHQRPDSGTDTSETVVVATLKSEEYGLAANLGRDLVAGGPNDRLRAYRRRARGNHEEEDTLVGREPPPSAPISQEP